MGLIRLLTRRGDIIITILNYFSEYCVSLIHCLKVVVGECLGGGGAFGLSWGRMLFYVGGGRGWGGCHVLEEYYWLFTAYYDSKEKDLRSYFCEDGLFRC